MLNISEDIDQKIKLAMRIEESGTKLNYALRRVSAARDISRDPEGPRVSGNVKKQNFPELKHCHSL